MTSTVKPSLDVAVAKAIEGVWLFLAFALPLAIVRDDVAVGGTQGPKVFLVRTAAVALVALMVAHWAVSPTKLPNASAAFKLAKRHPVAIAVAAIVLVTIVSALFSPIRPVSFSGVDPGLGSYSVESVLSYVVVFAAIAVHLRSEAQLRRLLWAITGGAIIVSIYGVGQYFGIDWFWPGAKPVRRITMTFGNSNFAGAYLFMTIPLSLAVWQSSRPNMTFVNHVWIGTGVIAVQMTALVFTFTRAAWISLAVGLIVMFGAAAWALGRRALLAPVLSLAVATLFALGMSYFPSGDATHLQGGVAGRLGTVGTSLDLQSGALNTRVVIWRGSLQIYRTLPWPDVSKYPEYPARGPAVVRWALGYGPEMFGYAYSLTDDTTTTKLAENAHDFVLQSLVETGLLGLIAYLALVAVVAWVTFHVVLSVKRGGAPPGLTWIAVAAAGAFVGGLVELLVNKSQVADLTLTWALLGIIIALPRIVAKPVQADVPSSRMSASRQRSRERSNANAERAVSVAGWKVGVAGVVAVGAVAVWWLYVAQPMAGLVTVARAAGTPSGSEAVTLLDQGISESHGGAYAYYDLANGWFITGKALSSPSDQIKALQNADNAIQASFVRDPMNPRNRALAGEISRRMAVVDPTFKDKAIRDYELVVALLPYNWTQWKELAYTLVSVKEPQRALDAVATAKALGGTGPDAYFLDYVEGKSYQELGNQAQVDRVVEQLKGIDNSLTAPLIADLTQAG